MARTAVLFVCLGNICRSPLAEAAFLQLLEHRGRRDAFTVDSAGTSGWHDGKLPDAGSIRVAQEIGIDIRYQRSRKLVRSDFDAFDVIVGMDASNMDAIRALHVGAPGQIVLLRDFDPRHPGADVPDPWQQSDDVFREVRDVIASCMPGLLRYIDTRSVK